MSEPPRNSASRFVANAGSSVLTTILRLTALVWVNQYLLRRIDPAEYALVPVITSLLVIAELFPNVFLRGLSRFMVEADARHDSHRLTTIVSSMLPVLFAIALLLFSAGITAAIRIDDVITVAPQYRTDAQIMLVVLVGLLCLRVVTTPLRIGLHVRMRFVEQNLILLASEILRVAVLMYLLLGVSTRVLWVVVATAAGGLLNTLVLVSCTYVILPAARFRPSFISVPTIKHLLGFSLWTFFQALNKLVVHAVPALLLNRHSTAIEVSSFHVGGLADSQIQKLILAAEAPAKPALTTIYATEGEQALQSFYYRGGRYYLWAALFLSPPLLVFAHSLIALYAGERYLTAATVMILLLGTYPFVWASGMFHQIAYAVGRIRLFNLCLFANSLTAVAGMWLGVVVWDMGAVGAALGIGITNILSNLLIMWPAGLHLVRGKWSTFLRLTLLPGLAPFATAVLACAIYSTVVSIDGWLKFFAGCGLSAAVYIFVLVAMCLDSTDKRLLVRARKKLSSRFVRKP